MPRREKLRAAGKRLVGGRRSRSFDAVLSRIVTIVQNGERIQLPAEQAFLLQLRSRSRSGDVSASELLADNTAVLSDLLEPGRVRRVIVVPGGINPVLVLLRMAKKLDRFSKQAHMKLEPWIVEAALDRLGDKKLTLDEQRTVFAATRTPYKVKWPDWWKAKDEQ